jgi:hypothetical protein
MTAPESESELKLPQPEELGMAEKKMGFQFAVYQVLH